MLCAFPLSGPVKGFVHPSYEVMPPKPTSAADIDARYRYASKNMVIGGHSYWTSASGDTLPRSYDVSHTEAVADLRRATGSEDDGRDVAFRKQRSGVSINDSMLKELGWEDYSEAASAARTIIEEFTRVSELMWNGTRKSGDWYCLSPIVFSLDNCHAKSTQEIWSNFPEYHFLMPSRIQKSRRLTHRTKLPPLVPPSSPISKVRTRAVNGAELLSQESESARHFLLSGRVKPWSRNVFTSSQDVNFAYGASIRVHEGTEKGAKVKEDGQSPEYAEAYELRVLDRRAT
ncbi:hypothetical protein H4582DRAFT_2060084 [Lactarius indigo]|nr:hypothetical protein H4582DRAFT_2060084 [Lactarius indigo]